MSRDPGKKILFLHSAGHQHDEEGSAMLLKYIKENLSADFQIIAPVMPHPEEPNYESWKNALKEIFKIMDDDMILIGHSLGGSVLLKFLSEERPTQTVRTLHLIAVPFWGLEDWEVDEFRLREDFAERLPSVSAIYIYHSKDDQIVSTQHAEKYAAELRGADYQELNGYGHVFWKGLPALIRDVKKNQ
jgi:predicted alpha/beta hydrolase family esterase